jgi:hypothetical protein
LRRPYRPFQVIGVLAAVLPIARKSRQFSHSAECAGKLPTPAQVNLAKSGERLHANTTPIPWAASSASQCSTKLPRGSYRTNSSCCSQQINDWRKSTDSLCDRSLEAWEAIMSSPIHLDDDIDPTMVYAPPWARERILPVAEPPPRSRVTTVAKTSPEKLKPKFSGDRAMIALQRQLALRPDLIPEPASKGTAVIRPLLMRFCSVAALAVLVAWGLASYSSVKKTAEIPTSIPAIASHHSNGVDVQPSQLRPTLSPTADALTPIGNSRPVAVATNDAAAVTSVAVAAPTTAQAVTSAPATSQRADDRRPLRLDSEEIAILIKRGKDLLADGDLAAARLLLRRAAEAGSAEGALTLGTTFDPAVLRRLGAIGATPDLAKARQWYQRAAELGSSAASQQLAGLADGR